MEYEKIPVDVEVLPYVAAKVYNPLLITSCNKGSARLHSFKPSPGPSIPYVAPDRVIYTLARVASAAYFVALPTSVAV